jgi:hypothetical protein
MGRRLRASYIGLRPVAELAAVDLRLIEGDGIHQAIPVSAPVASREYVRVMPARVCVARVPSGFLVYVVVTPS